MLQIIEDVVSQTEAVETATNGGFQVTIADGLMILAVLLAPLIAVQVTRYLDDKKEKRERRHMIFKTLMATRGSNLSVRHVEALNRIDLEFDKDCEGDKKVIRSWNAYRDFLSDLTLPSDQWSRKRIEKLVELLHEMGNVFGYDFDPTDIKNSSYSPQLYGDIDRFQSEIRAALREVFANRSLPVYVVNIPSTSGNKTQQPQTPEDEPETVLGEPKATE